MRILVALSLFLISFRAVSVDVPSTIYFAGIELNLTEPLQRKLKADMDLITKSPKGFQTKVDRANLHFPIIERVLREEGLSEDFKFLALQESSLVSDAVSTSNAVGYWQFKKETAIWVGLRVDNEIDERMHLIASSHGAATYMKKNNATLQNWLYALLAYNTGLGGVKPFVEAKYVGANKMTIDQDTHWYVIRFLAHKLAYENAVGKDTNPALLLIAHDFGSNKSLRDISGETEIDVQNLELYNKWLLQNKIPDDKTYSVLLPLTPLHKQQLESRNIITPQTGSPVIASTKETKKEEKRERKSRTSEFTGTLDIALLTNLNKIKAIKAKEGDTPAKLAIQGGVAVDDFLRYNDLKNYEAIVPGKIYFLQPKRKKASVMFHTVQEGETIKEISQLYGIKIKAIRTKNRLEKNESLESGRVLWLRSKRPENTPVEVKPLEDKPTQPEKQVVPAKQIITLPVQKQETTLDESGKYHEVKPGETLYGISKLYQVNVDSIKSWNNLSDNGIQPGMKLTIKNDTVPSSSSIEHVVMQGETMYQISKKYNVKVDDILKWNNKPDANVSIGERIVIYK